MVAAAIVGDSALYAVLPVYALDLGIPLFWVGLILSTNRLVRFVTNPLAAHLIDRWGSRRLLPPVMLLAAATTLTYGFTTQVPLLLAARAGWGFCWSMVRLASFDAVLRHTSPTHRGGWMGRFRSISRMGTMTAVLTGGFIADTWGYRTVFLTFAALTTGAFLVAAARRHLLFDGPALKAHPGSDSGPTKDGGWGCRPHPERERETGKHTVRVRGSWDGDARMRARSLWLLGGLVAWVSAGLVPSTLGLMVRLQYGEAVTVAGLTLGAATFTSLILSCRWAADILAAPLVGTWSDRWGLERSSYLLFLLGAVLLLAAVQPGPPTLFAAAAVLLLAALSGAITLTEVTAANTAQQGGGMRHLARFTTAADLGSALGPLAGYALGAGIGLGTVYFLAAVGMAGAVPLLRRVTARLQ